MFFGAMFIYTIQKPLWVAQFCLAKLGMHFFYWLTYIQLLSSLEMYIAICDARAGSVTVRRSRDPCFGLFRLVIFFLLLHVLRPQKVDRRELVYLCGVWCRTPRPRKATIYTYMPNMAYDSGTVICGYCSTVRHLVRVCDRFMVQCVERFIVAIQGRVAG